MPVLTNHHTIATTACFFFYFFIFLFYIYIYIEGEVEGEGSCKFNKNITPLPPNA